MPIFNWTSDVTVPSSQVRSSPNFDTSAATYSGICVQSSSLRCDDIIGEIKGATIGMPPSAAGGWCLEAQRPPG